MREAAWQANAREVGATVTAEWTGGGWARRGGSGARSGRGAPRKGRRTMGAPALLVLLLVAAGCDDDRVVTDPGAPPAPPRALDVYYYAGAVHVEWELDAAWDGEPFRVYARRAEDADYFLVAETTSCADGFCSYADRNIVPEVTYLYFVAAVNPRTGEEAASDEAVELWVPAPDPPPVPGGVEAVGLDRTVYVRWDDRSRDAEDFSFYRVYLEEEDGSTFFLGETDSEGFLDGLVQNGSSYGYFVTAVDDQGHESDGSAAAWATPRPDYHGELIVAHEDDPDASGFFFPESEEIDPILSGDDPDRHWRLERADDELWLVPAPDVEVHQEAHFTSALRCGPAADFDCIDLPEAPADGYAAAPVLLHPSYTYVVRHPAGGGSWRYGAVRVTHLGETQAGAVALFDWAHQLQADNPALSPVTASGGGLLGASSSR